MANRQERIERTLTAAFNGTNIQFKDAAKRDITNALESYKDLHIQVQSVEFPSQGRVNSVTLTGTIPVKIQSNTYNIPIQLAFWPRHPYTAPLCYVKPTSDMMIKESKYVDKNGRIFMPYLSEWNYPSNSTEELLHIMVMTFAEGSPVYAKPSRPPPPQPQPAASQSYQSTPYPTQSPMPYPVASGGLPSYPSQPSAQPSYNNAAPATQSSYNTSNTIQPEMIRASLLSAIEDRLRNKLDEKLAVSYAELQFARNTNEKLTQGQQQLKAMMTKIGDDERELLQAKEKLSKKKEEIENIIESAPSDAQMNIDDCIAPSTPLHKQLFKAFAEDAAIEDAIYFLGQALKRGTVSLDAYLKKVRDLSRQQFIARATMIKCRKTAGLNV